MACSPALPGLLKEMVGREDAFAGKPRSYSGTMPTERFSPLIRPSVSSPAFDLPAPSGGGVEAFIWGGGRVAPCGEAAHIERRSKRSRPEAMPPDECRSEGTPSPGEGPDVRGEPFFAYFFLAFEKKVSRRKGETISGRYRRNGYVHHAETGRLSGRLRKQAHSHSPPHYQIAGEKKGNRSCPKCLACSLHPERTTAYAYANPSR